MGVLCSPPLPNIMKKILVVDDNRDALELLVMLLELHGFETRGASPADQPEQVLREWQPDILLTDLNMPGLPGNMLAQKAAQMVPGLLRVGISGVSQELLDRALGAGHFDIVLQKPIDVDALAARLAA